jgi:hypothetical protein
MSSKLLDSTYKKYILEKIPILNNIIDVNNNKNLLDLIIDYCTLQSKKFDYKEDVKKILFKINNELKKNSNIYEIYLNLNAKRNNTETKKNKNKFLKIHNINALNLIEAILSFTYDYYIKDNKIYETFSMNKTSKKIILEMINLKNKDAISLDDFIKNLYKSDNSNKNQILLNVLIEIAKKINDLQKKCGFIHGDLHSLNIFLIPMHNIYSIYLIDFGLSSIILPTKNKDKKIILEMPVNIHLERYSRLDIDKDDRFKCIDLFRLIQYLYSRILYNKNSNVEYSDFITKLYNKTHFNKRIEKSHEYSKTKNFINQINDKNILYPEIFMKLTMDKLNQNESKSVSSSSSNHSSFFNIFKSPLKFNNNHSLLKSTKKLSITSPNTPPNTPPKRLIFGNNNNNNPSTPKKQKIIKNLNFSTP